jgi:hypothetical protein
MGKRTLNWLGLGRRPRQCLNRVGRWRGRRDAPQDVWISFRGGGHARVRVARGKKERCGGDDD